LKFFHTLENPDNAVLDRQVVGTKGGFIVGIVLTATTLLMLCTLLYLALMLIIIRPG